jgi:hypothetical protein
MSRHKATLADHRKVIEVSRVSRNRAQAANALGLTLSVYKERLAAARRALGIEKSSTAESAPSDTMDANRRTAVLTKTLHAPVRNDKDLIRDCQIDTDQWRVDHWVGNRWEVGAVVDGRILTQPLYQVKAWLERNDDVMDAKQRIADLKADLLKSVRPRPFRGTRRATGPHMLELMVPDLHIGKLAWGEETGHADYDSKIACDLWRKAIDTLVARASAGVHFERVVLPIGNDLFHSDTKAGTTTAGTPLDNDSRYHKMFLLGRRLMVETVERLRAIAPVVEVVVIPGNHDTLAAFHLGDALECWFRRETDVIVRNGPNPSKLVTYGKNAILLTHGNNGKLQDYPLWMATEHPEAWGKALHREIHSGDKHMLKVQEKMGVRVRIISSLCAPDAWHADNQFVGNERAAEAFVWHADEGLIGTHLFTAPKR